MLPITHNRPINIIFLDARNIADYQQHLIKPLLDFLAQKYADDYQALIVGRRRWLLAVHPTYGMVGGLCLSPPNTRPAVSSYPEQMFEFYQAARRSWLASHLFFSDEKVKILLSNAELISWHNTIFKEFYHVLIKLTAVRKLLRLKLLINQDIYTTLDHEQLPFLVEQPIKLDNQPFIVCHLRLPCEIMKKIDESLYIDNTILISSLLAKDTKIL